MNRLLNKVAIITGADGGICGKASELFCQEGAKIVMCDIDPHVEEKCAEIVAAGGQAVAVVGDASQRETWDKLLATALENYGTVDICVNGAARFAVGEYAGDWDMLRYFRRTQLISAMGGVQPGGGAPRPGEVLGSFMGPTPLRRPCRRRPCPCVCARQAWDSF